MFANILFNLKNIKNNELLSFGETEHLKTKSTFYHKDHNGFNQTM